GRSARQARDVILRAVRALPAPEWRLGPGEGPVRRSLLRHSQRVRAQLQTLGHRSAGALTAGPRASLLTHRRAPRPAARARAAVRKLRARSPPDARPQWDGSPNSG